MKNNNQEVSKPNGKKSQMTCIGKPQPKKAYLVYGTQLKCEQWVIGAETGKSDSGKKTPWAKVPGQKETWSVSPTPPERAWRKALKGRQI